MYLQIIKLKKKKKDYVSDYDYIIKNAEGTLISLTFSAYIQSYFILATKKGLKRLAKVKVWYMEMT